VSGHKFEYIDGIIDMLQYYRRTTKSS